jgi:hypothetical protein
MKKSILILAIAALLTSCFQTKDKGGMENSEANNSPAMKLLNSVDFTKEGLVSMVKSKDVLTDVEYEALILAYSKVGIDKDRLELDNNPVSSATSEVMKDHKAPANANEIKKKLLNNEYPQVRGYVVSSFKSIFGTSSSDCNELVKMLKEEKNDYVIKCGIKTLANEMKEPAVAEFIFSQVGNKHPAIRTQCAYAIGNSWTEGVKGAKEAVLKLMNDKDPDVQKAMYGSCGKLHDPTLVPEIVKALNDPAKVDLHSDCVKSLYAMWYDYPFHKQTNKEAYEATLAYFKKTPRTDKDPAWNSVGELATQAESNYAQWRSKATYFKPEEYVAVMSDIAKDINANWLARKAAIKVIKKIGKPSDLEAVKKAIESNSNDSKKDLVIRD